jgi:hypothetical protein
MADSFMNPELEKRLAVASQMQEGWQFVLDMLDGQIFEAQQHGWDQSQARMLVFSMFINTMMAPITGRSSD